jgi:hypothetical protein
MIGALEWTMKDYGKPQEKEGAFELLWRKTSLCNVMQKSGKGLQDDAENVSEEIVSMSLTATMQGTL